MNLFGTNPLMIFLIGFIFVKRTTLTSVKTVNSGTTVSLLCPNIMTKFGYISWFKQINGALPLCIVTQYFGEKQADSIYLNGFKKDHVEMSVNEKFSSLKIVNVDVSDSGMFYCGSFLGNYMMFHNKTQLVVVNETNQFKEDITNADCGANESSRSCQVYYTLTLILSGLVLLSTVFAIVVLIRMKKRNKHKDALSQDHNEETNKQLQKDQYPDLNFAPVSFSKKKNNRRPVRYSRDVEAHVVYVALR